MNKKTRIGLIVLVTVILVMAISITAQAISPVSPMCIAPWVAMDMDDPDNYTAAYVDGNREWVLDGTTLTSTCSGYIPLGERGPSRIQYLTLEEERDFICTTLGGGDPTHPACQIGDPFIVNPLVNPDYTTTVKYKNEVKESTDYSLTVYDNGDFVFVSVFNISAE